MATKYWPVAVAKNLASLEGADLVAVAGLGEREDTVRHHIGMAPAELAGRFGLALHEDPVEMVESERLDAVVLTTRHSQHVGWAERMAELGMHMYIPKTFATTLEDAERIVRAGESAGVRISVGPSGRHHTALAAAKSAVDAQLIGQPFSMRLSHNHGTIDAFGAEDWYRDEKEGGPELSLGWYVIDLVLYFMGQEVTSLFAQYDNYVSPGSPFMDCGKLVLRLANGGMASCDMYFCHRVPYPTWELELAGPKGVVKVQPEVGGDTRVAAWVYDADGQSQLPVPDGIPNYEVYWVEELRGRREPAISAKAAMEITRLSIAARESARTGKPVRL
jgi:predicted dehydrogenase